MGLAKEQLSGLAQLLQSSVVIACLCHSPFLKRAHNCEDHWLIIGITRCGCRMVIDWKGAFCFQGGSLNAVWLSVRARKMTLSVDRLIDFASSVRRSTKLRSMVSQQ